jgi:hypothetical protein
MKTLLTASIVALSSLNAFAERDVEINCQLSPEESSVVEKVSLRSATDEIEITYRDGSSELVKPAAASKRGFFGNETFSADLVWNNGKAYVPKTAAGELYVYFNCFLTPDIRFDRCISQGSKKTAEYAGVRMNLGGQGFTFFGKNICTRNDRS